MDALEGIAAACERGVERLARLLGILAAIAVAAIVILLVASSVRRYLMGVPVPITEELAALLFAALSFLSMSEGFMRDRQIRITLVWRHLPLRLQGWAMLAGHVITLAVLLWLIHWTLDFAMDSRDLGSRTYVSGIVLWPWMTLIPVALGCLALAVLARILVDLVLVLKGQPVREHRAATPTVH